MKQEFVTSRGKVVIERDVLYVRNLSLSFSNSILAEAIYLLLPIFLIILLLIDRDERWFLRIGILGVLTIIHLDKIYAFLFKKSYASRIPLKKIVAYEVKPDDVELEELVILQLKSGRFKTIHFRKLENQYQPFTELISQYISQPQLAN